MIARDTKRRLGWFTNTFSKKAENHAHDGHLAAGVAPELREAADIMKVLEDWEATRSWSSDPAHDG
jgi:hypothetical protein